MPSSVIRTFRYHAEDKALDITFTTGRKYRYLNVPAQTYDDMRAAFSKGEFFNQYIRDHYAFERLDA